MRFHIALILALFGMGTAVGQPLGKQLPSAVEHPTPSAAPAAELSSSDAVILGVIEGITEYLPISSTGHLIVASRALRLESDEPLVTADGQPLWYKKPSDSNPAGEPLTVKLAADTYTVVIQFGAIAAVALLYWRQIAAMIRGLFGKDPAGLRLLISVLVAFFPAAVLGFLLHDWIDAYLFSVPAVIVGLVAGAILMLFAESWRRKHQKPVAEAAPDTLDVPLSTALKIGLLQCLSMWPGTSRSMTTIVGGYFCGMEPKRAAEFSFLLGFVTLSAATLYKSLKSGAAMVQVFGWTQILLGCAVATVTAVIFVRFLVRWLTRHGLAMFAWYRVVLAAVLTVLHLQGYV